MMGNVTAQELLQKSFEFLEQSSKNVADGLPVNFDAFEIQVQSLCNKVEAMGREQAHQQGFEEGLSDLSLKLDALKQQMEQKQREIKASLENLDRQSKAQRAYIKTTKNDSGQ